MKDKLLCLLLFCSSVAMAQSYSGVEDIGKMKPGKMIFGDGKEHDVTIGYQMPELYKNPQNKFTITMDGGEPYTHSGGIEAFLVDGNIWALKNVPVKTDGYAAGARQFVIMTRQGAIEQYQYVYYGKPSDEPNTAYTDLLFKNRLRTINRKVATNEFVEGVLTDDKLREWIADSPQAMEDLRKAEAQAADAQKLQDSISANNANKPKEEVKAKGLLAKLEKASMKENEMKVSAAAKFDVGRILNNYNAYYEQQNPGKMKYYFQSPPAVQSLASLPKKAMTMEERKAENEARKDALFAGRTSSPSPEVASAKDNVPVKKETFTAKMERIEADGNKIGVVLYLKPVAVPKPDANSTSRPSMMMAEAMPDNSVPVEGEYMDESLQALGADFTAELNAALGTSDIELIDLNKIPYRDHKLGRLDDWWATKYKVVFAYSVDPRMKTTHEEIGGKTKFVASLNMITSLVVTEYIGGPDGTKQDFLAQILNMGSFVTPPYAQDDDMTEIKEIYEKTLEKLGVPILEKMKSERSDPMVKLVEKRLK